DLLARAAAELVRGNRELLRQVTVPKDFDAVDLALNQASTTQRYLVHLGTGVEALEIGTVGRHRADRARDVESALRQAPLNRRLTAFEGELADVAALASLLALHASARGLADSGTTPAPDATLAV